MERCRRWLGLVLSATAVACSPASEETEVIDSAEIEFRRRFTAEVVERANACMTAIFAEVQALGPEHPWAGLYFMGDGFGVNVDLAIAPAAGFVFKWHGCIGVYDRNYGSVRESNGNLLLSFEFENHREGFRGLDATFVPVAWGERRYLIAATELVSFVNEVNAGREPRDDFHGSLLLRRGDERKLVFGKPSLPPELSSLLLEAPLTARVIRVIESRMKHETDMDWRVSRVELDAGRTEGAFEGMELHFPGAVVAVVTVDRVDENTSEAEIRDYGKDAPVPEVGWKVSTRY